MDSPILVSVLLPAAIAVIMCSLGMELTRDDFRRVLTAPRAVAIGMLNLALISPLLALAVLRVFAVTVVPVTIGMGLRRREPSLTPSARSPASPGRPLSRSSRSSSAARGGRSPRRAPLPAASRH